MLTPNTLLQNRYLILSSIGQGGMGTVYEAKDQRLGKTVAIKETFFTDRKLRKAFEREAQLLANLHHPALPVVSDYFSEQDSLFLVMQFVAGADLSSLVKEKGKIEVEEVLRYGQQLLDILTYLHTQEPPIIHRDIKPANIKLNSRGEIVLLDFGLAKGYSPSQDFNTQNSTTSKSIFAFTPNYAPPEQMEGKGTDARSDIYACAATLYALMTGIPPVDAMKRALAMIISSTDPLLPAHKLEPKIPISLGEALYKAMSLNPSQRHQSAKELKESLTSASQKLLNPQLPGFEKLERYKIIQIVGLGEKGQTYKAKDTKTGKLVFIRYLSPKADRNLLLQHCQKLLKLKHRNILSLIDFDIENATPYLVFEFVSGPTLEDYIATHLHISPSVALNLAEQLFQALDYSHGLSIWHCNISPKNIWIDFDETEIIPKLLDFGTRLFESKDDFLTEEEIIKSIEYQPPEQIDGFKLSPNADVYALGQILWEMLVGKKAFSSNLNKILNEKKLHQDGLSLTEIDDVAPEVINFISNCTKFYRQQRLPITIAKEQISKIAQPIVPPLLAAPLNMGFELSESEKWPIGWLNSYGFVAGVSLNYSVKVVDLTDSKNHALQIQSKESTSDDEFGSIMQRCIARHLVGKKIRFDGQVKTENLTGWAGLWLRADANYKIMLCFDNMSDRPIKGTTPWKTYSIEMVVPEHTEWLNYGVLLAGKGIVWADNFKLSIKDKNGFWRPMILWNEDGYSSAHIQTLIL